jgi:uncharacterized phage-associated protein
MFTNGGDKMYNLFYIVNNILDKGMAEGIDITPMKLQKLLYLIYRAYLKKFGKPLFSERFEAWRFGPVLDSVYHEFKSYRDRPIKSFYKEDTGEIFIVNESNCSDFREVFNTIWSQYKDITPVKLSAMTHQDGGAWDKSVKNKTYILSDDDIKSEDWQ